MLVLLRHAESQFQVEKKFAGRMNCRLSEDGMKQAEEIARDLADYEFEYIFCSDLLRARETLEPILKAAHNKPEVQYAEELRERSDGTVEGMTHAEVRSMLPPKKYKLWERDYYEPPPMGESLKDVEDRVIPYLKEYVIPLVNSGTNVLVVSHANVMRVCFCYFKACDETDVLGIRIENAMPYVLYGNVRES